MSNADPAWNLLASRDETGLLRAVEDDSGRFGSRFLAASFLGDLRSKPAVPVLIRILRDVSPDVARAAAIALGKIGDPAALEPLAELAAKDSADEATRRCAVDSMVRLRSGRAEAFLISYLENGDRHLRRWAARRLARVGGSAAVPPLRKARRRDPLMRFRYSLALVACTAETRQLRG